MHQKFTPKDKLAEWFEIYAKAMELAVWSSTTIQDARYNDATRSWTVTLKRMIGDQETTRKSVTHSSCFETHVFEVLYFQAHCSSNGPFRREEFPLLYTRHRKL